MTEFDYVFEIHKDFTDRTKGKKSSLTSVVGAYALDMDLCNNILTSFGWEPAATARLRALQSALSDAAIALEVEAVRRVAVREFVSDCHKAVAAVATSPVHRHHVVEMLTGWILHERNDPDRELLLSQLATEEGNHWVYPYDERCSFPARVLRSYVLSRDVGCKVVPSSAHPQELTLTSTVNNWRGVTTCEMEFSDLRLTTPQPEVIDSLLPSPDLEPRQSSTAVFVRATKWCGVANAPAASDAITKLARGARTSLCESVSALKAPNDAAQNVTVTKFDTMIGEELVHVVEITFGGLRCPILERAWVKMRELYDAANQLTPKDPTHDNVFAQRLLTVLLRYASLSGGTTQTADQTSGFHAAVPPVVYAELRKRLHCVVEGFASPMNSASPLFCSLFPDTDSHFGSIGSFFRLSMREHFPKGISMTCNPPYSVTVMLRVSRQLERLFDEADELQVPIQVFVVVCNWDTTGSGNGAKILENLKKSKHCARHVSIPPSKAPFQDGHAFVLNRPFFTLASNTETFLWQNSVANAMWPSLRTVEFDNVLNFWSTLHVGDTTQDKKRGRDSAV